MNVSVHFLRLVNLQRLVLLGGMLALVVSAASAAGPTLEIRNVTVPSGRAIQVPIHGSDPSGGPLSFALVSISTTHLSYTWSPFNNRSLRLNVSGVDGAGSNFTGNLVMQLFEDVTPHTTARIIELVQTNFYNGLTFHRVVQDFMAQGGDPNGDGTGGTGLRFNDEFVWFLTFTGFGQLAMANSGDDSNDSQFFITDEDLSLSDPSRQPPQHLNFHHTIFGQLTSGLDLFRKVMSTPVQAQTNSTEVSRPVTPVVINSAVIFTNQQDAVMRLFAATNFTGTASVTVRATNASKVSTQATFQVTVVPNTAQDRPFLGTVPDLVTTANTPAAFPLTLTYLGSNPLNFQLLDAGPWDNNGTGVSPTNVVASYNQSNGLLILTPASNFTGVASLVLALYDVVNGQVDQFDTHHFSVTVYPKSFTVVPTKGSLVDSAKARGDKASMAGKLVFAADAVHGFNPTNDPVLVSLGDPREAIQFILPAGTQGWTAKSGKYAWKSPKDSPAKIAVQLDLAKNTFSVTLSGFDFPGQQSGLVHLSLFFGPNTGTDERIWAASGSKYGKFVLPKLP